VNLVDPWGLMECRFENGELHCSDSTTVIGTDPAREHDERMLLELLWASASNRAMWAAIAARREAPPADLEGDLGWALEGFVWFEENAEPFVVAGGAMTVGVFQIYLGMEVMVAAIELIPETAGASVIVIPAGTFLSLSGLYEATWGASVFAWQVRRLTGVKVPVPAEYLPRRWQWAFPRYPGGGR